MKKPICVMAGGTGGHIFPGLAVAEELVSRGQVVHWIGSRYGLEKNLVPEKGIPIHFLATRGLRGKKGLERITGVICLAVSIIQGNRFDVTSSAICLCRIWWIPCRTWRNCGPAHEGSCSDPRTKCGRWNDKSLSG